MTATSTRCPRSAAFTPSWPRKPISRWKRRCKTRADLKPGVGTGTGSGRPGGPPRPLFVGARGGGVGGGGGAIFVGRRAGGCDEVGFCRHLSQIRERHGEVCVRRQAIAKCRVICASEAATAAVRRFGPRVASTAGTLMRMAGKNGSRGDEEGKTGLITKTRPKTKKPSLYKVLLLNDDYTPMEFVVHVLERFFNKGREEATRIMLHVHQKGVGICGVYTYEIAETKV